MKGGLRAAEAVHVSQWNPSASRNSPGRLCVKRACFCNGCKIAHRRASRRSRGRPNAWVALSSGLLPAELALLLAIRAACGQVGALPFLGSSFQP
eukprot:9415629-Prorocentrum_lima.AAC.2